MKFVHIKGLMTDFHGSHPDAFAARRARFEDLIRDGIVEAGLPLLLNTITSEPIIWPVNSRIEVYTVPTVTGEEKPGMFMTLIVGVGLNTDDEDAIEKVVDALPLAAEFPYTAWRFGERPQVDQGASEVASTIGV